MRALLLVVMLVWVILPCSAATIAEGNYSPCPSCR